MMYRFLIFTVILANASIASFAQIEKNFIDQPYIEVTGSFDTLITPNQIFVRIVISERDTKDKISVEKMENQMFSSLKSLGINVEKNLSVRDMSSDFRKYFLREKDILKSKEYVLLVGDAPMVARVFGTLEGIGISNVSIERVSHSDMESLKGLCRSRSTWNAKTNAMNLVKPLQQNLGNAIYIVDNAPYSNEAAVRPRTALFRSSKMEEDTYDPAPIEFEKIKLSASVLVRFMLK